VETPPRRSHTGGRAGRLEWRAGPAEWDGQSHGSPISGRLVRDSAFAVCRRRIHCAVLIFARARETRMARGGVLWYVTRRSVGDVQTLPHVSTSGSTDESVARGSLASAVSLTGRSGG
jgi:hypothetical protein